MPAQVISQLEEAREEHMSEILSHVNDMGESSDGQSGSNSSIFDSF